MEREDEELSDALGAVHSVRGDLCSFAYAVCLGLGINRGRERRRIVRESVARLRRAADILDAMVKSEDGQKGA